MVVVVPLEVHLAPAVALAEVVAVNNGGGREDCSEIMVMVAAAMEAMMVTATLLKLVKETTKKKTMIMTVLGEEAKKKTLRQQVAQKTKPDQLWWRWQAASISSCLQSQSQLSSSKLQWCTRCNHRLK